MEKIAVWSWRLRRLLRCESGQIARALAEHSHEIKQSSAADSEELELPALSSLEIDSIIDHLFLPSKEELDKLLRYEAMINKQLNHALAELEKTAEAQERGIGSGADQRRHLRARLSILRNKANNSFIVSAAMYTGRMKRARSSRLWGIKRSWIARKARTMTREQFRREVEKELTERDTEPHEGSGLRPYLGVPARFSWFGRRICNAVPEVKQPQGYG